jgi:hypothetical protein
MFDTLRPETSHGVLSVESLEAYLSDSARDSAHQERLAGMARLGNDWNQRFHRDRQRAIAEGVRDDLVIQRLDEQLRQQIGQILMQEHVALVGEEKSDYLIRNSAGILHWPDEEFVKNAVCLPWDDPRAMPTAFCFQTVIRASASDAASRPSRKRRGDFWDWSHLVGAAYAHAFCCDERTARHLGDARQKLGLPSPIVFRGSDFSGFSEKLMATVSDATTQSSPAPRTH